jgi:hypothetical protein
MPKQHLNVMQASALHSKPARVTVTQIVKAEVLDVSIAASADELHGKLRRHADSCSIDRRWQRRRLGVDSVRLFQPALAVRLDKRNGDEMRRGDVYIVERKPIVTDARMRTFGQRADKPRRCVTESR